MCPSTPTAESPSRPRSHRPRALARLLTAGAVLGLGSVPLAAQTNDEINAGLQLDFSPPGARSLALGHAFVALADDATAAWANPAGLLWLSRTEVGIEARFRRDVQSFPDSGSASGTPTGRFLDTEEELIFRETAESNTGLAFTSFVTRPGERWRVSAYRHEMARFDARIESQGPFIREGALRSRLAAVRATLGLEIEQFGVAVAWRASDRFWVGGNLSLYDFRMDAVTRRYATVDPASPVSRPFFDEVPITDSNERDRHEQIGDDEAVGGVIGLLWHGRENKWSAGLVYRRAPEFDLTYRFEWGARSVFLAAGDRDGDGVIDIEPNLNFIDPGVEAALSGTTTFDLPDVWSLGFVYRPSSRLTISLQVDRVAYSSFEPEANLLLEGLANTAECGLFDPQGRPQPNVPCVLAPGRLERFHVPNTIEPRLGAEWVLDVGWPLFLRAGVWHDPDHRMVFRDAEGAPEDRLAARFRPGDDVTHGTLGIGIGKERFQVDLAVDISDLGEIVSLSTVYRF
ncbi:MAG: outer membrane protein transport protein [Holophagales bacterium]|nr:outer membrane protein transport protein [Holophagales bacterium]